MTEGWAAGAVDLEIALPLPADFVWAALADFAALPRRIEGVLSVSLVGAGVGAVRTIHREGGYSIERLDELDEANRRYAYSLVRSEPASVMNDYRVIVQVTPDGEERAIAKIRSRFDIRASQVERQKTLLSAIYHQVVHSIVPAR